MGGGGGPSASSLELGYLRFLLVKRGRVESLEYSWGWEVLIVDQVFLACLCSITLIGSMLVRL